MSLDRVPVCSFARACLCERSLAQPRQDPLNLLFTAAFTVELALNLFAKWWVERRPPASGGSTAPVMFQMTLVRILDF